MKLQRNSAWLSSFQVYGNFSQRHVSEAPDMIRPFLVTFRSRVTCTICQGSKDTCRLRMATRGFYYQTLVHQVPSKSLQLSTYVHYAAFPLLSPTIFFVSYLNKNPQIFVLLEHTL